MAVPVDSLCDLKTRETREPGVNEEEEGASLSREICRRNAAIERYSPRAQ